jgi:hypothetical membrane protein
VKRWVVVSSSVAPVAMIGGWTLAAALQPEFDSVRQTISALAGYGARDRWVMTAGLVLLGVCHVVTASGLIGARPAGRLLLALGGAATVVVAAFPLPTLGTSTPHASFAVVAFLALALWPIAAARRHAAVSIAATVVMLALLIAFGLQLGGLAYVGLLERLLAGVESLWPLVFVLAARRR